VHRVSVLLLTRAWQLYCVQFRTHICDPWGNVGENYGRICRRSVCFHYCKIWVDMMGYMFKKCVVIASVSAHWAPGTVN